MSNLTISVDEALIRKARVRAIQEGTSVSAKLREFLQHYVNQAPDAQAQQRQDAALNLMAALDAARHKAQPEASTTQQGRLRDAIYEGDFRANARPDAGERA